MFCMSLFLLMKIIAISFLNGFYINIYVKMKRSYTKIMLILCLLEQRIYVHTVCVVNRLIMKSL